MKVLRNVLFGRMQVTDSFVAQLIPGATKSGKQKTPEWLKGILEKLGQKPMEEDPAVAGLKPFEQRK